MRYHIFDSRQHFHFANSSILERSTYACLADRCNVCENFHVHHFDVMMKIVRLFYYFLATITNKKNKLASTTKKKRTLFEHFGVIQYLKFYKKYIATAMETFCKKKISILNKYFAFDKKIIYCVSRFFIKVNLTSCLYEITQMPNTDSY